MSMRSNDFQSVTPGTNTVLVMCSSQRTCELLSEYLSSMDPSAERGSKGRRMMERRLRLYLWWKGKLSSNQKEGRGIFQLPVSRLGDAPQLEPDANEGISDALRKKDAVKKDRLANRRRLRGGAPCCSGGTESTNSGEVAVVEQPRKRARCRQRRGRSLELWPGWAKCELKRTASRTCTIHLPPSRPRRVSAYYPLSLASQRAEGLLADDEVPILTPFDGGTQGLGVDVDEEIAMSLDTMISTQSSTRILGYFSLNRQLSCGHIQTTPMTALLSEIRPPLHRDVRAEPRFHRRIEVRYIQCSILVYTRE